jgi:hypothetical protein
MGHSTINQHKNETFPNLTPWKWMIFFETVVPMDRSTPAKFDYIMATKIYWANIRRCQKDWLSGHNIWRMSSKSIQCPWLTECSAGTTETCKICHLECLVMAEHVGFLLASWPYRWRWHVSVKCWSTFAGLHSIPEDGALQFLLPWLFAWCSDTVRPTLLTDIYSCISKVSTLAYFDISHKTFQFSDLLY